MGAQGELGKDDGAEVNAVEKLRALASAMEGAEFDVSPMWDLRECRWIAVDCAIHMELDQKELAGVHAFVGRVDELLKSLTERPS